MVGVKIASIFSFLNNNSRIAAHFDALLISLVFAISQTHIVVDNVIITVWRVLIMRFMIRARG
jgi:hypothetical protein